MCQVARTYYACGCLKAAHTVSCRETARKGGVYTDTKLDNRCGLKGVICGDTSRRLKDRIGIAPLRKASQDGSSE
jgi:hypothetical protein